MPVAGFECVMPYGKGWLSAEIPGRTCSLRSSPEKGLRATEPPERVLGRALARA